MKTKIIQICGTNGTGKTTLIKSLLSEGKFQRMLISVYGEEKEWWFDGRIAVIGKYNHANCCGVDAGKYTSEQLLNVTENIVAGYKPSAVIFEDIRFGGSYTFKRKAIELAKKNGAEYISVTLIARLETVCRRVIERTGNENVNFDGVRSKARQVIKSSQKIREEGFKVYFLDSEKLDKNKMLGAMKAIIYE